MFRFTLFYLILFVIVSVTIFSKINAEVSTPSTISDLADKAKEAVENAADSVKGKIDDLATMKPPEIKVSGLNSAPMNFASNTIMIIITAVVFVANLLH